MAKQSRSERPQGFPHKGPVSTREHYEWHVGYNGYAWGEVARGNGALSLLAYLSPDAPEP